MTYDEYIPHYTWLHTTSRYGYYPNDIARAQNVADFLLSRLSPVQSVLDCSAGRGVLLRMLQPHGVRCVATEADPWLCANDLKEFSPRCVRYDQLSTLQPEKYDAVVSIDVLEHLFSEDEVRAALRDLAALSMRWLCVSVGLTVSSWQCEHGETVKLHYVVQPAEWWDAEVLRVAVITHADTLHKSRMIFAETLCPPN